MSAKVRVRHYPHPKGWDEGFYGLVTVQGDRLVISVEPPGQYVGHLQIGWEVREWVSDRLIRADEHNHQLAVRMVQRHRAAHPFTPTPERRWPDERRL